MSPPHQTSSGPNGRLLLADGQEAEQLEIPLEELPVEGSDAVELSDLDEVQVWIFLTHRREEPNTGNILWHSELSLPNPPDNRGHILGWYGRIPLPPVRFGAVDFPEDDEGPDGPDISIDFR